MVALAANRADWGQYGCEKGEWGMVVQVWGPGGREWTDRWRAEMGAGIVVGYPSR
jgi:hypothetical protein